jgi:hypothetical protein
MSGLRRWQIDPGSDAVGDGSREAVLTAGMPVAFCFQKLLNSQSLRLPMFALGDHRLPSDLKPRDLGSQRVIFLLQFINLPGQVSH